MYLIHASIASLARFQGFLQSICNPSWVYLIWSTPCFNLQREDSFKTAYTWRKPLISLWILFLGLYMLFCLLFCFQETRNNLSCLFCPHAHPFHLLWSAGTFFVLLLGLLDVSTVCNLNFLLSCGSPIISYVILSIFSILISGISSNAGSSPDTMKNLHMTHLSLFYCTHPSCSTSDWLYVFKMTELLLWHVNELLWILQTELWILWMALSCHCYQCPF